jgi:hypothetical protein
LDRISYEVIPKKIYSAKQTDDYTREDLGRDGMSMPM